MWHASWRHMHIACYCDHGMGMHVLQDFWFRRNPKGGFNKLCTTATQCLWSCTLLTYALTCPKLIMKWNGNGGDSPVFKSYSQGIRKFSLRPSYRLFTSSRQLAPLWRTTGMTEPYQMSQSGVRMIIAQYVTYALLRCKPQVVLSHGPWRSPWTKGLPV